VIFTYNNLLSPGGAWITGGPGTVTVDVVSGQITIVADGTGLVYARRAAATQINKTYQLTWSNDTATLMFRQIGSSEGLADIRGANVSANGDNKIEFTAISTTTWISFQRTTPATVIASSISLQEVPAVATSARRLNAKNQYLSLDVQASGLRMSNANFYIGGWMAFEYEPTIGVYIMDFGRIDPSSPAGGAGRVRMWWLSDQSRLAVSTCESAGTNYRENYIIKDLPVRTWHYVGLTALTNADVLLRIGTQKGVSYVGTTLPPISATEICRVFQLGAKVFNPRNSFSPCRYSDWIWASNWIPSDAQINELASGKRPSEVSGLTPPTGAALYHWAMSNPSGDEASLITTGAPLVSNSAYGSIITVPGLISEEAQVVSTTPLDIIIT
jgi:hypothetical protein